MIADFQAPDRGFRIAAHGQGQMLYPGVSVGQGFRGHQGVVVKVKGVFAGQDFGAAGQPVAGRGRAHVDRQKNGLEQLRPQLGLPAAQH